MNNQLAVEHLFQYLDARPGRLLFAYESSYLPIVTAVRKFLQQKPHEVDFLVVEDCTPEVLFDKLSSAEKFLCAFNRTFGSGLTEQVKIMTERATTLGTRAYTLADLSAAFFGVFQTCPSDIQFLNRRLIRVLQQGKKLTITDQNGTHLEVALSPTYDWVNMDCFTELDFDLTVNLPVGEVATYSPKVEGELYFTGALLGTIPIGRKYGAVKKPIYFEISDNSVNRIRADDSNLQRDLEFCLYFDEYTHYVNEVAVGTNVAVPRPLLGFNYKYEENGFGFHMGFGASLAQMNVERLTPHHLDLVFESSKVVLDGEVLFDGKYHLDRFPASEVEVPLRLAARTCCGFFDIGKKVKIVEKLS